VGLVADVPDLSEDASPERMVRAIAENVAATDPSPHDHHGGDRAQTVSVRTAEHRGHRISIRAVYEIEVDDQPFNPQVIVDNAGRVHYHGLPTRDFASLVDLVKRAIDTFPEDFREEPEPPTEHDEGTDPPTPSHHHHDPGGHAGAPHGGDEHP
jgi:hypothetical protein